MRKMRLAGAVLLVWLASTVVASAQVDGDDDGCDNWYIDRSRGIVECRDPTTQDKNDGFWTGDVAQTVYAALGLGLTVAAGLFTRQMVRKKRQVMSGLLETVNATYMSAKNDPEDGIPRLKMLAADALQRYQKGRLDDTQFIEVDKRVKECVIDLRVMSLEHRFPDLPPALFGDLRHVVRDGVLSEPDIQRIERRGAAMKVPAAQRKQLAQALQAWAESDPSAAEPPMVRRAVLIKR